MMGYNRGDTLSGSGEHSSPLPLARELLPRRIDSNSDQTEQGSSEPTFAGKPGTSDNGWISLLSLVLWEGGSSFDAWLTASSVQVAQVLLTLPYSFAQLGLASGIAFQILYGFVGCWACYLMTALYADYRSIKENQHVSFKNHTIQWYEVLGGLLGPWWKAVGLIFSTTYLFCGSIIQLVACGSTVYYINDTLPKRTWTLIFGALFIFTVLIPTAQNYRLWSFLGILMTTYTAWYLTIAAALNGQVPDVKYTEANSLELYFTGASNILYAFGGHAVTIEIMHAMWRPRKYKVMYLYAVLYIFSLTIPSASAVYWAFGDRLLTITNAFAFFPKTKFRDAAVCVMLMHQSAIEQPPVWIFRSWRVMFAINACVVVLMVTVGVGMGGWASIKFFVKQVHSFGLFAKCYQCPKKYKQL
ncbi:hypothetical protein O6H91_19G023700 [Diphasiastrum complanatum]|uniref:Uncharacterized protein n=1 Tax=Diphasiastrum complanatum TaxID=34168 RepID=A0ACC2ATF5_DIPCM|nr:hypothetical protein O6H91_19G023700 [Diphasiastrum complanatum]